MCRKTGGHILSVFSHIRKNRNNERCRKCIENHQCDFQFSVEREQVENDHICQNQQSCHNDQSQNNRLKHRSQQFFFQVQLVAYHQKNNSADRCCNGADQLTDDTSCCRIHHQTSYTGGTEHNTKCHTKEAFIGKHIFQQCFCIYFFSIYRSQASKPDRVSEYGLSQIHRCKSGLAAYDQTIQCIP